MFHTTSLFELQLILDAIDDSEWIANLAILGNLTDRVTSPTHLSLQNRILAPSPTVYLIFPLNFSNPPEIAFQGLRCVPLDTTLESHPFS
ncbi:hypothetical protein LguiA_016922 [Lonicera macranthoides]